MLQFRHIAVSNEELEPSNGSALDRATRVEIIQRWKVGQSINQIQDTLGIKRNAVRAVIDPDYRKSASERTRQPIAREGEPATKRGNYAKLDIPGGQPVYQQLDQEPPTDPSTEEKPPKEPKPTQRQLALMSEEGKKFDPNATPDDCREDLRRVQRENKYSFVSRTMYQHQGKYSEATWSRHFGTFLEFRRQAGLQLHRSQHMIEKQIAKHASLDDFRQYYRRDIEPIQMLYPRAAKAAINTIVDISDNHDRMQDPFVYRVFLEVLRDMQPDVVLFNGDQADCYEFSKYTVDPRNAEIVKSMFFLRDKIFRAAREVCPDSEIVWNLGNHEWRVQKHMAIASPYTGSVLADFHGWTWADFFGIRDLQINVNCKWDLGAFNKADEQEEIKNNWVVFWDSFVAMHIRNDKFGMPGTSGHIHKQQLYTGSVLNKGTPAPYSWTITPSACRGNAEYTDGFDKSDRGFAIFHVMPETGIVVPEPVLIQGDFAAVGGKYYYRRPDEVYLPTQMSWT
jgi:hypothetical protein